MSYGLSLLDGGLKVIDEGFIGMSLVSKGRGIADTFNMFRRDMPTWRYSVYSKTPPVIFALAWDMTRSFYYVPLVTVRIGDLYHYHFARNNNESAPYYYVYNTDVASNRGEYGIEVYDKNGNIVFHSGMTTLKPINGATIGNGYGTIPAGNHYYNFGAINGRRIALNTCGGFMQAYEQNGLETTGYTNSLQIIDATTLRAGLVPIFRIPDPNVASSWNRYYGSTNPNFRYMYIMSIDVTDIDF